MVVVTAQVSPLRLRGSPPLPPDGDWDWGRWLAGLANAPRVLLLTVVDEPNGYTKKPPSHYD